MHRQHAVPLFYSYPAGRVALPLEFAELILHAPQRKTCKSEKARKPVSDKGPPNMVYLVAFRQFITKIQDGVMKHFIGYSFYTVVFLQILNVPAKEYKRCRIRMNAAYFSDTIQLLKNGWGVFFGVGHKQGAEPLHFRALFLHHPFSRI